MGPRASSRAGQPLAAPRHHRRGTSGSGCPTAVEVSPLTTGGTVPEPAAATMAGGGSCEPEDAVPVCVAPPPFVGVVPRPAGSRREREAWLPPGRTPSGSTPGRIVPGSTCPAPSTTPPTVVVVVSTTPPTVVVVVSTTPPTVVVVVSTTPPTVVVVVSTTPPTVVVVVSTTPPTVVVVVSTTPPAVVVVVSTTHPRSSGGHGSAEANGATTTSPVTATTIDPTSERRVTRKRMSSIVRLVDGAGNRSSAPRPVGLHHVGTGRKP